MDKTVDKCYLPVRQAGRPQPFPSDAKRVEFLFELYEQYAAGLLAGENDIAVSKNLLQKMTWPRSPK